MMYILDEASGVGDQIFEAIDGNRAGGSIKVFMLSQPTRTEGEFFEAFDSKKDFYKTFTVSSAETPNAVEGRNVIPGLASREWIEEKKLEYGEDSPFYKVRVCGEFVRGEAGKVISLRSPARVRPSMGGHAGRRTAPDRDRPGSRTERGKATRARLLSAADTSFSESSSRTASLSDEAHLAHLLGALLHPIAFPASGPWCSSTVRVALALPSSVTFAASRTRTPIAFSSSAFARANAVECRSRMCARCATSFGHRRAIMDSRGRRDLR